MTPRPTESNPLYCKRIQNLTIQLTQGDASYTMHSSDLSPEYIDFNRSEYAYWKQARKDGLV